ncbi:MAG: SUMF1/EgtB/PvdO family nonheme iron enzyme [Verrucomicrobia bacterium]|nr:SUMF1/EgtB/PvdO family nonheme iron enzyme [Verrucomicrobiota bacterium]
MITSRIKKYRAVSVLLLAGAAARGQEPVITNIAIGPRLTILSQIGVTNQIQYTNRLAGSNAWMVLASLVVTQSPYSFLDVGALSDAARFYRVVVPTNPVAQLSNMALIPAGSFTMGDNLDGDSSALPLHMVYVSAFYMDKYDVTKALWDDVYSWAITHGYSFDYGAVGKAANHPAQFMTWYDAVRWCNARSDKEGRVPAYYTDGGLSVRFRSGQVAPYVNWGSGYRLPTEAEWEKAARGGASGQRFPWGNTISWSQANYYASPLSWTYDVNPTSGYDPAFNDGVPPYTSPVDYFAPNGYGLYDMGGNVWQWCWDWYGLYSSGSQTDPEPLRVLLPVGEPQQQLPDRVQHQHWVPFCSRPRSVSGRAKAEWPGAGWRSEG